MLLKKSFWNGRSLHAVLVAVVAKSISASDGGVVISGGGVVMMVSGGHVPVP